MQDQRQPTRRVNVQELDQLFAARMRELRNLRNVSQADLAHTLSVRYGIKLDDSAITRIEKNATGAKGARVLRLIEAWAIADALGSNIEAMIQSASLDTKLEIARREYAKARDMSKIARHHLDQTRSTLTQMEAARVRHPSAAEALKRAGLLEKMFELNELTVDIEESGGDPWVDHDVIKLVSELMNVVEPLWRERPRPHEEDFDPADFGGGGTGKTFYFEPLDGIAQTFAPKDQEAAIERAVTDALGHDDNRLKGDTGGHTGKSEE